MALLRGFWHGGPLGPYEALCLTSFLHHGHQVELFAYDPDLVLPDGAKLRDAASILPAERLFFYAQGLGRGSVAGFTNLFRYTLLAREPGWWVDTDVVCLAPDLPEAARYFAWEGPDRNLVGNAVLKLPPGDPLLAALLAPDHLFRPDVPWGTAGPYLLTDTLRQAGRLDEAAPHGGVYPWHFSRAFAIFDPDAADELQAATASAAMQHLWHENFRCSGLPKHLAPPEDSHLDRLFRRHGIGFPPGPRLLATDLARLARVTRQAQFADALAAETTRLRDALAVETMRAGALEAERDHLAAAQQGDSRLRAALVALNDDLSARLVDAAAPAWRRWIDGRLR